MEEINLGSLVIPVITPQKGVDYYTENEIKQIKQEICDLVNESVESAEQVRQESEVLRQNNESNRIEAENERSLKENERSGNEDNRAKNENDREANEEERKQNEINRQSTYDEKVAEFDNMMVNIKDMTDTYNINAQEKLDQYNQNANEVQMQFNNNCVEKENEFNKKYEQSILELEKYNDTEFKQKIRDIEDEQTAQDEKIASNTENIQNLQKNDEQQDVEIEKLKEENEELKRSNNNYENILPKGQASGESITIKDSADASVKSFEISGNSRQETRKGYNLLNIIANSTNINGVDVTINNDKSIKLKGTATSNTQFILMEDFTLENGKTYSLYSGAKGSSTTYGLYINQYYNNENHFHASYASVQEFVYNEESKNTNSIYAFVNSGATVDVTLYPMLVKGSYTDETMPKYEPYGVMPSLDYPSDVRSCGDNVNLLNSKNIVAQTIDGIEFTPIFDENKNLLYINVNGTSTSEQATTYEQLEIDIEENQNYVFSGCPSNGTENTYSMYMIKKETWDVSVGCYGKATSFKGKAGTYSVRIRIKSGFTANNLKFYPKIEKAQ